MRLRARRRRGGKEGRVREERQKKIIVNDSVIASLGSVVPARRDGVMRVVVVVGIVVV